MSERLDDRIGTIVDGYRLLEVLGRGAVSDVYRAEDRAGEAWAVKVLRQAVAPGEVRRFAREREVAARVAHVNIRSVFATGVFGGLTYQVMELVDGVSQSCFELQTP